ncbi:MAG: hypothetical protein ACREUP_12535, partial [Burkholderiales bacterium]
GQAIEQLGDEGMEAMGADRSGGLPQDFDGRGVSVSVSDILPIGLTPNAPIRSVVGWPGQISPSP